MNDNDMKNPNEMDKPQAEETAVEEITQEEPCQDVLENDQAINVDDLVAEQQEDETIEQPVKMKKPMKTGAVVAITAVSTLFVCAIVLFVCYKFFYNPYNSNCKYMDTIEKYAEYNNQTVEDFKSQYKMPADMPGDTYLSVAEFYLPVSYLAEANGQDIDTYVSSLGLPEEYTKKITGATTRGELYEMFDEYSKSASQGSGDNN